jgi:hypothetical protein
MFNMKEEKKVWKQRKIPLEEFEAITGSLEASVSDEVSVIRADSVADLQIRYGYLRVTSPEITLKWDRNTNNFSVSGLYGL